HSCRPGRRQRDILVHRRAHQITAAHAGKSLAGDSQRAEGIEDRMRRRHRTKTRIILVVVRCVAVSASLMRKGIRQASPPSAISFSATIGGARKEAPRRYEELLQPR